MGAGISPDSGDLNENDFAMDAARLVRSAAIVLLGYCAFVAADTWVFQQRESRHLQSLLEDHNVRSRSRPLRPKA